LATVAAMDIYVATTGDDETGDGLVGNPYLTITRAYQDVPYTLRHLVHIHVAAGAYTDWPQGINNHYEVGGRLSFDGTAAMADVSAGPHTIAAGALVALTGSLTFDIPVVGGGLAVGAWDGLFMEMLDGAQSGSLYAIVENDATDIRIQGFYAMPSAGDTFKIIEPGAVVTLPAVDATIRSDGDDKQNSKDLNIVGMKLVASDSIKVDARFLRVACSIIDCASITFTNCDLVSSFAGADTSVLDVPAYVAGSIPAIMTDAVGGKYIFFQGMCSVVGVAFLRSLDMSSGSLDLIMSSIKNLVDYGIDAYRGILSIATTYIEAKSTHGALRLTDCGNFHIDGLYIQAGIAGIHVVRMSNGTISALTGVDANVTNGLLLANGSRLSINAAACVLVGATGAGTAVRWNSGAADSAYPAANLEVNDALGAQVVGT